MTIFRDIWQLAHRFKQSGLDEKVFIALIGRRRVRNKAVPGKTEFDSDNRFYKPYRKYADEDRA